MAGSRPTIWFISERAEWIRHTLSRLPNRVCTANIVVHGWRSLSGDPRATPRLLLWDLSDWQSHHQSIMRRYAGRFYSVASVVSIESGARSGEAALSCLIGLGYTRVVVSEPRETSNLPALVSDLLESAVYLLPGVMRSLGAANYRLARAYAAILAEPAVARTVDGWGRALGYSGRHAIEALHREARLSRPWAILSWLRLAGAVDWASSQDRAPSLNAVARRFNYSSGRYLNRHSVSLAGVRFPELLNRRPGGVLALMSRDARIKTV